MMADKVASPELVDRKVIESQLMGWQSKLGQLNEERSQLNRQLDMTNAQMLETRGAISALKQILSALETKKEKEGSNG